MIEKYVGQVVDLKSFSDGAHFKNSSANDYYVFGNGENGFWLFFHRFIDNTNRAERVLILPKASIGFEVVGNEANYKVAYHRYIYGDYRTIKYELVVERVLREEFDISVDLATYYHDLFDGKDIKLYSHGVETILNLDKINEFLQIDEVS